MKPVTVIDGDNPIVLAMPHTGTFVPDEIMAKLNPTGQELSDTDWHIDRLYADLLPSAAVVKANFHRYVIDANRDPSGASLYPGQNTTGLCPLIDFDGNAIYTESEEPDSAEIEARRQLYHRPYHDALKQQLDAAKQRHGIAVLYDCHSIRSLIPYLFDGKLPDFNIGTFDGRSCDPSIELSVQKSSASAEPYSAVTNARFKGGWTTRHYGQPDTGVHAVQMELSQCNYMLEQAPWSYQADAAHRLRDVLGPLLQQLEKTALQMV